MAFAPPKYITWEEFLERTDDDARVEWVDGEVVCMSPVNASHQEVGLFIIRLLTEYLEANPIGRLFYEGYLMRNRQRPSGRLPDILFVSNEHDVRVTSTYLDGPADLAVEIVSPESRRRDTVDKLREYEAFGVSEYWCVDVSNREVRFFRLSIAGAYEEIAVDANAIYCSEAIPGLWMSVEWLWPGNQPTMRQVRQEWGIG